MAAARKKKERATNASGLTKHQVARVENRARIYRNAIEIADEMPPYAGEYTDTLGEGLAAMVVDGATLDQIATLPNMPPLWHMTRWVAKSDHPFHKLYYGAKEALVALYEERAQSAASTPLIGVTRVRRQAVTRDGDVVDLEEEREADNVERSKLIVNTYQWGLSHMSPRKHGRNAEESKDGPTEQLKALFQSIRSGPVKGT